MYSLVLDSRMHFCAFGPLDQFELFPPPPRGPFHSSFLVSGSIRAAQIGMYAFQNASLCITSTNARETHSYKFYLALLFVRCNVETFLYDLVRSDRVTDADRNIVWNPGFFEPPEYIQAQFLNGTYLVDSRAQFSMPRLNGFVTGSHSNAKRPFAEKRD